MSRRPTSALLDFKGYFNCSRKEATELFKPFMTHDGIYLVRPSESKEHGSSYTSSYTLSMTYQGEVIHLRILQDEATKFFLNNDELFSSIDALIQHYKRNELNMVHRTSFKLLAPVTQSRDCSQPRSQSQPVINRDSNHRRMFANHGAQLVSSVLPQQARSTMPRAFLPRVHSVQEDEQPPERCVPTAPSLPDVLHNYQDDLPSGWQVSVTTAGRIFYIDSNTGTTSWIHPREITIQEEERSENVVGIEQDMSLPPGWELRKAPDGRTFFIDHNTRTTTWEHPQRHSASREPLPSEWEAGHLPDGRIFYMNRVTKETQWADPRIKYKVQHNTQAPKIQYDRNYKQKYMNFKASLKAKHTVPDEIKLSVNRSNLLETSYEAVMEESDPERLKSRLVIEFEGELGLDYGGVAREWFCLISHEMFNPYYGLFEYSASDEYTLQINAYSHFCNDNHLSFFEFIGRVCGMAVYHSRLIDAYFIRPLYKMMLGKKITLSDMQAVDVEFYNSLDFILNNDPEPLCIYFSTTKDIFGEVVEVDLKPNGRNIPVTERNKNEYVDLMLKWKFVGQVRKQMNSFMKGFSELIPLQLLSVFDERELEYLMCGLPTIDIEDWKKYTVFSGYKSDDHVIRWFWRAVESFDNETRARLLQFVTGTTKVPMNGFRELQGSDGRQKFTIKKTGNPNSLPLSHTCFNRLDLPPYPNYLTLLEKLTLAVENTEGFNIE
ncbi:E3 ubiquitin-protein ligase NEDD4-like isoform X2 [Dysidea avara]|uniref:E3 ubiquitin-protein ligase NEDD4-like isoform X2 n=1 Tax=Dysidea avara TaxID=196820 RepID=UPI003332A5B8